MEVFLGVQGLNWGEKSIVMNQCHRPLKQTKSLQFCEHKEYFINVLCVDLFSKDTSCHSYRDILYVDLIFHSYKDK